MTQTGKAKIFQTFTAVDLVTIAVFAAIYRALWYVWHALAFIFPFNQVINTFFLCLAAVTAAVIVRKSLAMFLYAVAYGIINILLQGELLVTAAIDLSVSFLPVIYLASRVAAGDDPFVKPREMFIAGLLMALTRTFINWLLFFPVFYQVNVGTQMTIVMLIVSTIGGALGGAVGYALGNRIKGLIG